MSRRVLAITVLSCGLIVGAAACGTDGVTIGGCEAPASAAASDVTDGPLRIITTVAPLTDIVSAVAAGTPTVVDGVVPEGVDSHTFEPAPSMAASLETADVVFLNGLGLEQPTRRLVDSTVAEGTVVCELGSEVLDPADYIFDRSFPEDAGLPNPHLWTSPPMVVDYLDLIVDVLSVRDPVNADAYASNRSTFVEQIDRLDRAIRASTETVAPKDRVLVTYHDAYAYFALEYGWSVLAAPQPASFAEPSPQDVAELIERVRETGVPAIFGSEVFPSPILESIADETGATYVDDLRDDDLPGDPGDPDHSWFGLMTFNYITMIEALGGDASELRNL